MIKWDKLNPVTVINEGGESDWLLVCEHASNNVPAGMKNLGLSDAVLQQHMAYDIGAYEITLAMAKALNATAVVANYSRLVIDCNRPVSNKDCIPLSSDGLVIPKNNNLSDEDKRLIIDNIYQPFHDCVAKVLANKRLKNPRTKFANIHSFTPMLASDGVQRPWDIGFVYREPYLSKQLINYIEDNTNYVVGDNQPYNGFELPGYTIPEHAESNSIPSFLVEFRQDKVSDTVGVEYWTNLLIKAMKATV